jgi:DNA-binding protein H-NS
MKKIAKMTLKELTARKQNIESELVWIADRMEAEKEKEKEVIRAEAEKLAAASGMTIADLFGKARKKRKALRRVYNPSNKSQSWGGAGPKPKWLKEIEANA